MIHNGIEYGLMQAYAEGFDILRVAPARTACRTSSATTSTSPTIAEVWRRGSVVASWLLDLTRRRSPRARRSIASPGTCPDSGEGRWTIQTAVEGRCPADVLAASLFARFRSRQDHTFAEKLLSAMREQFGGHREPK